MLTDGRKLIEPPTRQALFALAVFVVPEAVLVAYAVAISPIAFTWADAIAATGYAVEGVGLALVILLLLGTRTVWSKIVAGALATAQIVFIVVQLVSYHFTLDFLPWIALENIDNIRLVLTPFTLIALAVAFIYAIGVALWVRDFAPSERSRLGAVVAAVLISPVFIIPLGEAAGAKNIVSVPTDPPVVAMSRMLLRLPSATNSDGFILSQINTDELLPSYPADADYPLVKERVYSSGPIAAPAGGNPPNVIIIFGEGLSARLVNAYDDTFPGLTPELSAFAEDPRSLVVRDYYSHTAATFPAILGQLCSIYPAIINHPAWRQGYNARFRCLTSLFKEAGYATAFLDPHFRDADYLHDMIDHLGFDEVLTAEDLMARHLDGRNPKDAVVRLDMPFVEPTIALTDRDTFAALSDAAAIRDAGRPRLTVVYNFETHAWIDTAENGITYEDGRNNTLNTAHNFDVWFGKFWRAFRESDAYRDTVVIVTADHARYHEASYMQALAERGVTDYRRLFTDKIPLIIHDPRGVFAKEWSAQNATSIDFAPTIAHYLGLPNGPNPFLGTSIFERDRNVGLVNYDATFVVAWGGEVIDISRNSKERFEVLRQRVFDIQKLMEDDRLWPPDGL